MRVKHVFAPKVVTDPNEAVRRMVLDAHALEACAQAIGVSHQTLSKKLNPDEDAQLSLRQAAAIEQFLESDGLAECFAARRGKLLVTLPNFDGVTDQELLQLSGKHLQELGEFSAALSNALSNDKTIDADELDRIEKEYREAAGAFAALMARARALARQGPKK
jgi:hypothetical protein